MNKKHCRTIAVAAAQDLFEQVTNPIDLLKFLGFASDQMHHFVVERKITQGGGDDPHYFFIRIITDIVSAWFEKPTNPIDLIANGFEELYQAGHYEWYSTGMSNMMKMLAEIGNEYPATFAHIMVLYTIDKHLLKYHEVYHSKTSHS
jgi:hypothetical protein